MSAHVVVTLIDTFPEHFFMYKSNAKHISYITLINTQNLGVVSIS